MIEIGVFSKHVIHSLAFFFHLSFGWYVRITRKKRPATDDMFGKNRPSLSSVEEGGEDQWKKHPAMDDRFGNNRLSLSSVEEGWEVNPGCVRPCGKRARN